MIISKNELKARTSEYIEEVIARTEDFVADKLVKASANHEYKVHICCSDDIPWWALNDVGARYRAEGYIVENAVYSLWFVIDDEVYEKQKKEAPKKGVGVGLMTREEIQKNLMDAWFGIMGVGTWERLSRAEARFKNCITLAQSNGYKVKKDKGGNYLPELED